MTTPTSIDPFGARAPLGPGLPDLYRLDAVADRIDLGSLPVTVKILLENLLRHAGGGVVDPADVETLLAWRPGAAAEAEIPFMPARVLLQDFTGVPAVVDLAVMRDAMADLGGDPAKVNPLVPADLVIDHSVQIDRFGTPGAFAFNVEREYERNGERYQLLRWAQTAFRDLRVVPPGTGIVHQVNLEFLATVVTDRDDGDGGRVAFPDTRRRHRLAHDDGQRPRRPGLRRRRHRGRGGPARPAALPADAARRRGPPPRRAAARLDRDRPRPGRDRDASRARRGRGVRRVRRRRPGHAGPRRPDDDQQHEPRVRGDRDALPDRRRDARLPAPDRPLARAARAGRALRQGPGPVARARRRPGLRRAARARPGERRAVRGRAAPAPGPRAARDPARELPVELPERAGGATWRTWAARSPSPATASSRTRRPRRSRPRIRRRSRRATRSTTSRRRPTRSIAAAATGRRAVPTARSRLEIDGRPYADPDRVGRDRRDHLLHQHLEPDGDGRRRPAGTQRRRPRPARRADRQDIAGAGLARGHRLSRGGRADGAARDARVRPGRLRLHDVHRQLRAARRGGRRGRSRRTTWSSPRSCRATATSRAGSTRSRARATWPPRPSSSPSRWPAGSTST